MNDIDIVEYIIPFLYNDTSADCLKKLSHVNKLFNQEFKDKADSLYIHEWFSISAGFFFRQSLSSMFANYYIKDNTYKFEILSGHHNNIHQDATFTIEHGNCSLILDLGTRIYNSNVIDYNYGLKTTRTYKNINSLSHLKQNLKECPLSGVHWISQVDRKYVCFGE